MSELTFSDYQAKAKVTAKPSAMNLMYLLGGLSVEGAEPLEKYIKAIRDEDGVVSDELRKAILKEVGDVLWFTALVCEFFEEDLENVAQGNLDKLYSRMERGVIGGSGDDR